jgi:hypothetical protein
VKRLLKSSRSLILSDHDKIEVFSSSPPFFF